MVLAKCARRVISCRQVVFGSECIDTDSLPAPDCKLGGGKRLDATELLMDRITGCFVYCEKLLKQVVAAEVGRMMISPV